MRVADAVAEFLSDITDCIFLLPGGGSIHLVDAIGKNEDLEYVCALHEQGAVIAAEAYAQYKNSVGVALVTTGPGGTNAVTGIAAAWIDSTPLLVIGGQVQTKDMIGNTGLRQHGFQEANNVEIMKPITKVSGTVMEPSQVVKTLEMAHDVAMSPRRGPVWIEIPLDIQGAEI